jgi:GWxTD domain-containing protein
MMRPLPTVLLCGLLGLGSVFIVSRCAAPAPSLRLLPDEEDFLSKVRYIITGREKKTFLSLPSPDRPKFIKEFWEKRDPDPSTEENEFKDAYLARLAEADRLFPGEGRPGWLTDRGRIYILLGPPTNKEEYRGGYMDAIRQILRDTIVWYYEGIPIFFVDNRGTGEFDLAAQSLDELEALNTLLDLRSGGSQTSPDGRVLFDFRHILTTDKSGLRFLVLQIPYRCLWFSEKEKRLVTTLRLRLRITDAERRLVAGHDQDYPLSFSETDLLKLSGRTYDLTIPLLLKAGPYEAWVTLQNGASGEELKKKIEFTIKGGQQP